MLRNACLLSILCLLLSACGGSDEMPQQQGGTSMAVIGDHMTTFENILVDLDGSLAFPFAGLVTDANVPYRHDFNIIGYSFCQPANPLSPPDSNIANGSWYGCDNSVNITYQLIDPATLQLTVTIPSLFLDADGGYVAIVGYTGNYDGYVTASNVSIVFNVQVTDNGDGSFSLGAVSNLQPLGFSYDSADITTSNSTLNSLLAGGIIDSTLSLPVQLSYWEVQGAIEDSIASLGPFTF